MTDKFTCLHQTIRPDSPTVESNRYAGTGARRESKRAGKPGFLRVCPRSFLKPCTEPENHYPSGACLELINACHPRHAPRVETTCLIQDRFANCLHSGKENHEGERAHAVHFPLLVHTPTNLQSGQMDANFPHFETVGETNKSTAINVATCSGDVLPSITVPGFDFGLFQQQMKKCF